MLRFPNSMGAGERRLDASSRLHSRRRGPRGVVVGALCYVSECFETETPGWSLMGAIQHFDWKDPGPCQFSASCFHPAFPSHWFLFGIALDAYFHLNTTKRRETLRLYAVPEKQNACPDDLGHSEYPCLFAIPETGTFALGAFCLLRSLFPFLLSGCCCMFLLLSFLSQYFLHLVLLCNAGFSWHTLVCDI